MSFTDIVAAALRLLLCLFVGSSQDNVIPQCKGRTVVSPDRVCTAYYYKIAPDAITDNTRSIIDTNVHVECRVEAGHQSGAIILGFKNLPDIGIALRWLSNDVLEVAIPPEAQVESNHFPTAAHKRIWGRQLTFQRRDMTPADREWRGCQSKKSCF